MSLDEMMLHEQPAAAELEPVTTAAPAPINGVRTGVLIGFRDAGVTPLVLFPGQPGTAAIAARTTVDLHGAHIGRAIVLMFDAGDPLQPIVMGCIKGENTAPAAQPGNVEIDADGERLIVSARDQLVLRCGKASITLTRSGKVLIHGEYVSTRSTGVNRVRGGSVQIN